MRYVIVRDDDTNALTPINCLETLYRPFLRRGLPVNLATIPNVRTTTKIPDGRFEGFLMARNGRTPETLPIGSNRQLVGYLRSNPGYNIVQHGLYHDYFEFDCQDQMEVRRRLDDGTRLLMEAGFPKPKTFVAPYDKFSRTSLNEVARRFPVLSSGWFELGRLPLAWWPKYLLKKITKKPHWEVRKTALLSHPGCLLSCHRPYNSMLNEVRKAVQRGRVTVLVTHWWEYFRDNEPDEEFICQLHQTAAYLANAPYIKVISFDELAAGTISLN
ncbi:DUF2334 domain-containing protein [Pedosphaera parvula]|uniref:Polysaccharide deacetylase n=1 Tax=Pedosphaera parvula (strain Ellin514) TaxID=320771 RepID=B9X9T0_PEDPL|nr:DUF2334 domain-containing protein [Pedosphaera parvula]EEF63231.1 hypothetical protein Cflav_PD5866 [Pedosphaera parvula Ellin514]